MPDILRRLGKEVLIIDGAMGTMLQRVGIPPEQCPEQLNLTAPDVITEIHHNYVLAGAECITTNTFGGSRAKLGEYGLADEVEPFNRAAVRLARQSGAQHVLANVGPSGKVLRPSGDAAFDEVFDVFAEQASALAAESPDAILIETMTDISEARCAVLACREVCDLPVFASVTFGQDGRMELSGTEPEVAALVLEAAGATAVGMNCGLGPEHMLPLVERMARATSLPIVVQPNAGIPWLEDGRTIFPGTPDEMGEHAARFVDLGATLVGSCCGSSPVFTGAIMDLAKNRAIGGRPIPQPGVHVAGPRRRVRIGGGAPFVVIGERINPTGKKALSEELRAGSLSIVRESALAQQREGADMLDVNVGAAGVDARLMLSEAVIALSGLVDAPLAIDTTDPVALEAALRVYPGRALVNSVSGGAASLADILPLVRRYGAAVVVLALDDDGIPHGSDDRLEVIRKVREAAHSVGVRDSDLLIDCLTLTAATDPGAPATTLACVRAASDLGLSTVLGASNVSHGLPGRSELNAAFIRLARETGLSSAIADPSDRDVEPRRGAFDVLTGADERAARWIEEFIVRPDRGLPADELTAEDRLAAAIEAGDADSAPRLVDALLAEGADAQEVISEVLTPAIQRLGEAFGRGEIFLPQLMVAAEAMSAASRAARTHLPESGGRSAGRVAFATVKGDIHSIGKDICVSLLESQGFIVRDLGVDVASELIVDAAGEVDVVCLSALMTTTLPSMEAAVRAIREARELPVLVGGAVVTAEWAASVGAGYAEDAPGCVSAVRALLESGKERAS